jgi:hypothetical protein
MATRRRRTTRFKPTEPLDETSDTVPVSDTEGLEPLNALLDVIRQKMPADHVVTARAPTQVSAQRPDGTYKTATVNGGDEFIFSGMRIGARKQIIFEFKPFDTVWKQIELDERKVFDAFEGFEQSCIEWLGYSAGEFVNAKAELLMTYATRKERAKRDAKENEKRQLLDVAENNPRWGIF